MNKAKLIAIIVALFVLSTTIIGCSGSQDETLSAEEILSNSYSTMKSLDGFSFLIGVEGSDIFLDEATTIKFMQAAGNFDAPDKVSGDIKITFASIVAEISIINIGEQKWETNPLTGKWQESTTEYAFQPLSLLNPDTGIIALISQDASDLTMETGAEIEELPGIELIKLDGSLSGSNLSALTLGLIDDQTLNVELWITPEIFELNRLVIIDPPDEEETTSTIWTMDFWNFGVISDIQPPQ